MKKGTKFFVVSCLMVVAVLGVACGGNAEGNSRQFILFHPDASLNDTDQTELEDATGVRIFERLSESLDFTTAGWATYRWPDCKINSGDVDGYKLSYFERVGDEVYVGSGLCLNAGNLNIVEGERIEQLREVIDDVKADADRDTSENLTETCQLYTEQLASFDTPTQEIYLFMGTIGDRSTISICHPRQEIIGSERFGARDDFNRNYLEEALDELGEYDESWKLYQFPKLGTPNTPFADPPKLSYFTATDDGSAFIASGIYLDENNPLIGPNDRIEDLRSRVQEASSLIRSQGLDDAIAEFESNARFTGDEMGEAYVFVWENR